MPGKARFCQDKGMEIIDHLRGLPEETAYQILTSPWRWGELFLVNKDGSERRYWEHQKEDLDDTHPKIVHQDGTEAGKTFNIGTDILHFLFTTRGQQGLCVAPLTNHLITIIEEVYYQCRNNPVIASCIHPDRGLIRQPYFKIKFKSESTVVFCPASNNGEAYDSLHVNRIWADQAAGITAKAWSVLLQRQLPGCRLRVYSYPDGRRDTHYFRFTKEAKEKPESPEEFKLYHWPTTITPLWSEQRKKEKIKEHGGEDTPEYQHMILGLHGKPAYNAFDIESFFACLRDVPGFRIINISSEDFNDSDGNEIKGEKNLTERITKMFENVGSPTRAGSSWIGCDTGYTSDPAEYNVWREENGLLRKVLRVHLDQVSYPLQAKIIAALDRNFKFTGIGLDNGGNGLSIYQDMKTRDEFANLTDLDDRLFGFDFGGTIVTEVENDGSAIKRRVKEFMTELINGALRRRLATFPKQDEKAEEQYVGHIYTMNDKGQIIYGKKNDHIIDGDRVAFLIREYILRLRELEDGYEEVPCVAAASTKAIF